MNTEHIQAQREILAAEFKRDVSFSKDEKDKKIIYENQRKTANEIMLTFFNGVTKFVQLIAQPGSGKTSVFFYLIYLMCTHIDDNFIIPVKRVFVITGMNDKDWEKQTKRNILPGCKKSHVYHGGCLKKLNRKIEKLKSKHAFNNCLIVIDECHVAA